MGTDPPDVHWAIVSGLTGPGNLEHLPLVLLLVFDHRTPGTAQISINWGAFAKSHSWFLLFFFSLSPLPSFSPTLSLLPSSACWPFPLFFWKVLFFMIYLLSFQSLFSVSSGYFIYHSGPLGGQSVLRRSYFWGIQCSICLANIGSHFLTNKTADVGMSTPVYLADSSWEQVLFILNLSGSRTSLSTVTGWGWPTILKWPSQIGKALYSMVRGEVYLFFPEGQKQRRMCPQSP